MATLADVQIIGVAHTPWSRREDAPHQPSAAREAEGRIEILSPFRAALADLGSFRRLWVIFLFHRSTGWSTPVKPPRGGPKRGVLSTRAPNRPTPIGLSNLELLSIDTATGTLRVRGIDLLDQTPILDLKPYLSFIDSAPDAGNGWLDPFLESGCEPRLKKPYRPPA